jgi:glutamate--cysteine ligase
MVELQGPGLSTQTILMAEAARQSWQTDDALGKSGESLLLKITLPEGDNITFEPGGQVEFSSLPLPCLSDALRRVREVQALLDRVYAEHGARFVQLGINPWHPVDAIGLKMPKDRYLAMDAYYKRIGPFGQRMMRQTCTVQVNLDFGPTLEDLSERYLASMLVAPVAAALFAASPVVDGQATHELGYRRKVWEHTDPTHTGLIGLAPLANAVMRGDYQEAYAVAVDSYLDFALRATVVFVAGRDYKVPDLGFTMKNWLATPFEGLSPNLDDFKTHLSLLFPEVRARGFLELRSADCLPRAFQAVPAAFWCGLLYHRQTRKKLIDLLRPLVSIHNKLLSDSAFGLSKEPIRKIAQDVMELAHEGLSQLPDCYRPEGARRALEVFSESFTAKGLTIADRLRSVLSNGALPLSALRDLEDEWTLLVT